MPSLLSRDISQSGIQQHIDNGVRDQLEHYNSKHLFYGYSRERLVFNNDPIHQSTESSQNANIQNFFDLSCLKLKRFPVIIMNMYYIPFLGKDLILLAYFRPKYMHHRLFALGLELPEETLVNLHRFDAVGESYGTHDTITILYRILTSYFGPISPFHEIVRPLTFDLPFSGQSSASWS